MIVANTMIRVLLVQYSLSGETSHATEEFLKGLETEYEKVSIVRQTIQPDPPFAFPWSFWDFFDVMPETIHPTPWRRSVIPPTIDEEEEKEKFDLVVLGWQTWYLSPSLPVRLAVENPHYQSLFNQKGQRVVLIGTHRNMWHHASNTLCKSLQKHCPNLNIAGRINFCQSSPFLKSVVETLQRQLQVTSGVAATTAQQDAKEEGQRFARHLLQSSSSSNALYQGGTRWNPTLAFCEDTFFPIKRTAAKIAGWFPPGSLARKLVLIVYIPILLSAIVGLAPPVLLLGNLKSKLSGGEW